MKNRKGQLGIVLIIIFILILVISIIIAISYMNKKIGETEKEEQINYIDFFLKSVDSRTKELIISDYILISNGSIISQGTISDWLNLIVDSKSEYNLYCWNKEHYLTNISKKIKNEEIKLNSSKIICNQEEIGKLKITNSGSIESKFISLNISTDKTFKNIEICEAHTIGITRVNLIGFYCSYWNNISSHVEKTYSNGSKYYIPVYYRDNLRFCDGWGLNCEKFENNRCYIKESNVPNRLKKKVDHCWDIKKDLNESSLQVSFNLDTFNTNEKDKVTLYILDKESRLIDGNLTKFDEIKIDSDYIDIGANDSIVEVI